MGVQEVQVMCHGSLEVFLVGVDLLKAREHAPQPATSLHSLVVEGRLQEAGQPYHLIQGRLVNLRCRCQILILLGNIICHPSHLPCCQRQRSP